jgi:YegS/Rv2252/BmrU family lipid kinase
MQKIFVIINPWAGRGTAGRRRPELDAALRQAGAEYEMLATHARGGATELAWQAVERGFERIIGVGGDGTLNEIVNGVKGAEASLGRRARLGIIPLGTGSDFIKVLDGVEPNDIPGGVRRAVSDRFRPVDLGRAQVGEDQPRYFINAIGMGLDAQVAAESLKLTKLKGFAVYLVAILRALANYKAHPMTVEYDGNRVHRRLLFASIANGRCQGGGFWLTPDALIDDGLLDICMVDRMRLDQIIRHIPKVMEGSHGRLRQVRMSRARTITISCGAPLPVATDGEVISTDAHSVTIQIVPSAIEILV